MSFCDVHQFIVGDIKQLALDQPLDVPAVLLEHTDFRADLPVAQIDIVDFFLHALNLELQILVHRQAALIVKNLVNQENIDAAQNKEKYFFLSVHPESALYIELLGCDIPRLTVAFVFIHRKIKDIFYSFVVFRTYDRIHTSIKSFVGMHAAALRLNQYDIGIPSAQPIPLLDDVQNRLRRFRFFKDNDVVVVDSDLIHRLVGLPGLGDENAARFQKNGDPFGQGPVRDVQESHGRVMGKVLWSRDLLRVLSLVDDDGLTALGAVEPEFFRLGDAVVREHETGLAMRTTDVHPFLP
jgi:hypothetical protein